ncbi:MAG: Tm-1-like ATP-binding domain-containing protein [Burkholderiaceae bacterium]
MPARTILVIGTFDTKQDELGYLAQCIIDQQGSVLTMDVGVMRDPARPVDFSRHDVAGAGGASIEQAMASDHENAAMQIMARGATALALRLFDQRRFDGVVLLGGSMGTDLALDVCAALPLGLPKVIVSTIAFSPLIPPERLAPDLQMILWAGGLYGLNDLCRSSLSQAAGAVLGAARAAVPPAGERPLIGMTSLGSSALRYMLPLKPALESRGYEVAVFHATGMGGRAFESLAARGLFACVFDLCTQELGNHVHGSTVSAGPGRLTAAGRRGIPQIVAPGCHDLVDLPGWQPIPPKWADSPRHEHNRLITSLVLDAPERRVVADAHGRQLAQAVGPTTLILPGGGCGEWDREGAALHDPEGLAAFCDQMRHACPANTMLVDLAAHINDAAFAETALAVFDDWVSRGLVPGTVS